MSYTRLVYLLDMNYYHYKLDNGTQKKREKWQAPG
jgi:hypothetical protein